MSEGALVLGLDGAVVLLAIGGIAVDAEEVLELLGEVAGAIGVLVGGHGEASVPLLAGKRALWRGVEESRHRG